MAASTFNHAAVAGRLETLLLHGSVFLTWAEIGLWWNFRRIDKKPWRDLHELWAELWERQPFAEGNAPALRVRGATESNRGGVTIIRAYLRELDGSEMTLGESGLAPIPRLPGRRVPRPRLVQSAE